MICIDNSEWMRNGDYAPSRFQTQADAVNLICGAKTQVKPIIDTYCFFLFLENSWSENEIWIVIVGLRRGELCDMSLFLQFFWCPSVDLYLRWRWAQFLWQRCYLYYWWLFKFRCFHGICLGFEIWLMLFLFLCSLTQKTRWEFSQWLGRGFVFWSLLRVIWARY